MEVPTTPKPLTLVALFLFHPDLKGCARIAESVGPGGRGRSGLGGDGRGGTTFMGRRGEDHDHLIFHFSRKCKSHVPVCSCGLCQLRRSLLCHCRFVVLLHIQAYIKVDPTLPLCPAVPRSLLCRSFSLKRFTRDSDRRGVLFRRAV